MFRRHKRRPINIVFVIFRLVLSVVIFAILLTGIYSAYKHFSALDPVKIDLQNIAANILAAKAPKEILGVLSSFKLTQKVANLPSPKTHPQDTSKTPSPKSAGLVFKFMVLADSHSDSSFLQKALKQAKQNYPQIKFIIGLGDYTDVGTISEMQAAKKEFDAQGIRYFLAVGDHDLWDARDKGKEPLSNFRQIFGPSYQSFIEDNFRFIILYNSDNYLGLGEEQLNWLLGELQKTKEEGNQAVFVFLHEPLYHPSSDHIMGRVEAKLKLEAKNLIRKLAEANIRQVFAGDIHYFSEYKEPETNLSMVTIGALSPQRNSQAPRYGIVSVYEDGSTKVEDVEIR